MHVSQRRKNPKNTWWVLQSANSQYSCGWHSCLNAKTWFKLYLFQPWTKSDICNNFTSVHCTIAFRHVIWRPSKPQARAMLVNNTAAIIWLFSYNDFQNQFYKLLVLNYLSSTRQSFYLLFLSHVHIISILILPFRKFHHYCNSLGVIVIIIDK